MTNCLDVRENICAYIDSELNREERLYFEEHIKNCAACRKELDEMSSIIGYCTSLPQKELPMNFKSELHEKLLAVAERPASNVRSFRKTKSFIYTRTFASIAAGILLIFLAGSFYRMGLLNPAKSSNDSAKSTAMAAEQPAQAQMAGAGSMENGDGASDAGITEEAMQSFGAPADEVESFEADRSSTLTDREIAITGADLMSQIETASNRVSSITITADNPEEELEKVSALALENNGDVAEEAAAEQNMSMKAVENETEDMSLQVKKSFLIPDTQYDQFVTTLYTTFGEENVQLGAFVTEDMTDSLNNNIAKANEIDSRIQELRNSDSKEDSGEIDKLKAEKETVDSQIEEIRLGTDFINITVMINKK